MKRINHKKELKRFFQQPVISLKPVSREQADRIYNQLRSLQNKSNIIVHSEPSNMVFMPWTSAKRARFIKFHLKAIV